MRTAAAAVLATLLLAPGTARAQAMTSDLPPKINQAIDNGVKWLKARQIKDGAEKDSWGTGNNPLYPGGSGPAHPLYIGITAFALYTLLECDVDPEDPTIVSGMEYIHKNLDRNFSVDGVAGNAGGGNLRVMCYEAAALLMMYEAFYDAKWEKQIRAAKKDPRKEKKPAVKLDQDHDGICKGAVNFLVKTQSRTGGWRYGPPAFPSPLGVDQDTSSTQITLLGLVSAVRMGLAVDAKVFHTAVITTLENQSKDGPLAKPKKPVDGGGTMVQETDKCRGWAYTPGTGDSKDQQVSGGMTASGICSLIIIKSQLKGNALFNKELQARVEKGIFDGLAWLDANWTVTSNPGGHRSHYYYLYGLERVGVLGGIDMIGANAWYVQGAIHLVGAQRPDGHWNSGTELEPADVLDTCFALLFLKKATMPVGVVLTR
ncbi:MAG: hypothetical protein HUU15_10370 [Candidatus Brocadiae bacterium]|nr:hypothetical protein [Candidatus Brocadiia bacterium]